MSQKTNEVLSELKLWLKANKPLREQIKRELEADGSN